MSAKVRFRSFAGVLGVVVSAAVAVTVAQTPPAPPGSPAPARPAPPSPPAAPPLPPEHSSFTMLENRGSRLGVMVQDLASSARGGGVRIDTVITAVDGTAVRDAADLAERVGRASDDTVSVAYLRDKVSATASVTLAPRTPRGTPPDQRRPVRPTRFMRPA